MGKVNNWELCKKRILNHNNKLYGHNPESIPENETHEILCNFETQTDEQILTRRLEEVLINKKKIIFQLIDFAFAAEHSESEGR